MKNLAVFLLEFTQCCKMYGGSLGQDENLEITETTEIPKKY